MKRLGALVVVALLAGCHDRDGGAKDAGPTDAGPAQLSEKEPNGRPEQAQAVSQSAIVVASLSADPSNPDEDWYLLSPAAPQQANVTLSGINGQDVQLGIFDQDKNPLLTVNSEGEGKGERFPNLSVVNRLYLRVSGAKKGQGGAYTLTVLFSPPEDGFEREPNDRAVDATVLPLGAELKGFVGHAADEDWYRVELPEPPPPPEPAPPAVAEDAGAAAALPPSGAAPDPGGAENMGGTVPSPTAALPAGEPAPSPTEMGTVPVAPAQVAANPAQAADASAPAPEEPAAALRIELSGVEGARLQLSVLTEAEAPLFETKGETGEALTLRNIGVRPSDRVIYVVVKSAWTGTGKDARRGYNAQAPYALSVSLEPAGANAEFEPNDELARATALPENGYREGFLSPKTDEDYYVLRTGQPVLASFVLSGVERTDLALEVVRAKEGGGEETVLRANDGDLKEPEYLNDVYCPAECYVKVEGAARKVDGKWVRDYENAQQPYRLTVSTVADVGAEEREPNNAAADATPVALGHPMRGTLQPRRDVDYYRLDLSTRPVRTPIKATLLGILKVDLGLYLHRLEPDGSLSLVQTSDRAKREQPETIRYSAEPGVYLLEVRDSTRRYESNFQDRYQLTVQEGD